MKYLPLLALLLCGCASENVRPVGKISGGYEVQRIRDDSLGVTCWIVYNVGISCVTDAQLR